MLWKKKHKMGAVRSVDRDGYYHPSKLEAGFYDAYLWPRLQCGDFTEIEKHPSVSLGWEAMLDNDGNELYRKQIKWAVDYRVKLPSGEWVYYEPKGSEDNTYKRKLRMWKMCGPGVLYVAKGRYNSKTGKWYFKLAEYAP